jgi:rare lipoprotein A (peptidoglycan hydrolase)
LLLTATATARPPGEPRPLTPADFRPIVVPAPSPFATTTHGVIAGDDPLDAIQDFATQGTTPAPRPTPLDRAAARSEAIAPATPKDRQPSIRLTGHSATGTATWYCETGVSACHHSYPGGLYAAAGPELRVGNWRGRYVRVCGNGSCVTVQLIDWCACGGNHIIDLYSDAFRHLAPLSAGGVRVRVSW